MKTFVAKPSTIEKKWYVVDADGQTLGRLATASPTAARQAQAASTRRTSTPATSSSSSTPRRSSSRATSSTRRCTTGTPATPAASRSGRYGAARPPARRGPAHGRQGHAAAQQARRARSSASSRSMPARSIPTWPSTHDRSRSRSRRVATVTYRAPASARPVSRASSSLPASADRRQRQDIDEYFARRVLQTIAVMPFEATHRRPSSTSAST